MNPWAIDGLVVLAYFVVIVSIGLYKGRGEKSMEGFAIGDRNIPWWAVLASIMAAEVSAATFLGAPDEGFEKHNFTYVQLTIGTILARIIVAYLFIRRYYDLRVVSIYEFLETRFGRSTKLASSATFLVTRALASGSRMFAPAAMLVMAWVLIKGFHPDHAQTLWLYVGAVGTLTMFTAIYTAFGGIKAVVWTDLLQVILMYGAMIYAIVFLLQAVGGWQEVKRALVTAPLNEDTVAARLKEDAAENAAQNISGDAALGKARAEARASTGGPLDFWNTGIVAGEGFWKNVKNVLGNEYTIFSALLASIFVTMATHGTDQDMVQRMLTAKDVRRSRRSLILSGVADLPVAFSFTFIGVLLWAYYHLPAHTAQRPDDGYFTHFILEELAPGVRGVMAAGLFATAMGSLSTALNALATSFTRDFYLGILRPAASQREQMSAARWSTVFFAVLLSAIGVGTAWVMFANPGARIIPLVLGSFGYTYGSLLGIFLVGITTRSRGSAAGNIVAMLAGFIVVAVLTDLPNGIAAMFGGHLYSAPGWLPRIAFPWRITFGTVATFLVAMLFPTPASQVAEAAARLAQARKTGDAGGGATGVSQC